MRLPPRKEPTGELKIEYVAALAAAERGNTRVLTIVGTTGKHQGDLMDAVEQAVAKQWIPRLGLTVEAMTVLLRGEETSSWCYDLAGVRGRRRPRARAVRRLVRAVPALVRRVARGDAGAAAAGRVSASTCSTCRRSTRSGTRTAKGRTTRSSTVEDDVGSPWAIGAEEGGHEALHPDLGTWKDFDALVTAAGAAGIEVALDFAIQCSPDHPWLKEHPEWFNRRPDGTLKYAENPPKRYQDIYNVNFESEDWRGLWQALLDVVLGWVDRGVTVFRVDNPHTKPVAFWEWLIREVRTAHPEVIFLAEAFTRPAIMTTLAKLGFAQSYTYFTWKNTKTELREFVDQVLGWKLFDRPNMFANTPDILHEYLQVGGQPAFEARLVLAATLSPSYGIYSGYESYENVPVRTGSEEYLDSEKYEVKKRTLDGPLLPLVGAPLNEIRRAEPALQRMEGLQWLETESDQLIAFAKGDVIVVVSSTRSPSAKAYAPCR